MIEEAYESVWTKKLKDDFESGRAQIVSTLLPEIRGEFLLDIGCGNGEMGLYFSGRFNRLYGVDISDTALESSRKNGLITRKVNLNTEPLPFESQYFDMITCLDVIEHVFDPRFLLTEMARVLKPEGLLVVSFPNIAFIKFRLALLAGSYSFTSDDTDMYDGGHIHYWTVRDMVKLLRQFSLKTLKIGSTGRVIRIKNLWPNLLARNPFIVAIKV